MNTVWSESYHHQYSLELYRYSISFLHSVSRRLTLQLHWGLPCALASGCLQPIGDAAGDGGERGEKPRCLFVCSFPAGLLWWFSSISGPPWLLPAGVLHSALSLESSTSQSLPHLRFQVKGWWHSPQASSFGGLHDPSLYSLKPCPPLCKEPLSKHSSINQLE